MILKASTWCSSEAAVASRAVRSVPLGGVSSVVTTNSPCFSLLENFIAVNNPRFEFDALCASRGDYWKKKCILDKFFYVVFHCFFICFLLLVQIGERFHKCHQVLIQIQVQGVWSGSSAAVSAVGVTAQDKLT